ncbi:MAG: hypothetical protein ACFCBU_03570 [Cyanophyceae cyanobacterium]
MALPTLRDRRAQRPLKGLLKGLLLPQGDSIFLAFVSFLTVEGVDYGGAIAG